MLKKIFLVILIIIIGFVVVVSLQPTDFEVSRSQTIIAPSDLVFERVDSFYAWNEWSPWAKIDPNAKASFEGPVFGKGAIMRWAGNKDIGEGSMEITASRPVESIDIKLDFIKPFKGTNQVFFTFKQEGDKTLVTWTMKAKNNFFAKAINMFIDCEKMIGDMYQKGLDNLKAQVESSNPPPSKEEQ